MNRPIKFRAWVKHHTDGTWHMSKIRWINLEDGSVCTESGMRPDEVVLMQYTGLKDNNGKDIWEGDIVETAGGYIGVVTFGFVTCSGDEEKQFLCWFIQCKKLQIPLDEDSEMWATVIGNIWDNPELLEGGA